MSKKEIKRALETESGVYMAFFIVTLVTSTLLLVWASIENNVFFAILGMLLIKLSFEIFERVKYLDELSEEVR